MHRYNDAPSTGSFLNLGTRNISGQVILLNEIKDKSFNTQKLLNFGTVDKGFQHYRFSSSYLPSFENFFNKNGS